jgi:predicted site-specific integrase-resolvase
VQRVTAPLPGFRRRKIRMYTLHNAARVLGVSIGTVRRWIADDKMETEIIETDRKRVYLSFDQIVELADKHRPLKMRGPDQEKSAPEQTGLYSIAEAAELLGVGYNTVSAWMSESNIERKTVMSDKKRVYISYSDLVALSKKIQSQHSV